MAEQKYDVIVIGAGPAGATAAILCARQGLKTLCLDQLRDRANQPLPGGTCLTEGCIPAKILLDLAEQYRRLRQGHPGIMISGLQLDLPTAQLHIEKTVHDISDRIALTMAQYGVDLICAKGRLLEGKQVEASKPGEEPQIIKAEHIVLAAGSDSMTLPSLPLDGRTIVDPLCALRLQEIPPNLTIIGAGVIGMEIAGIWSRFGSQVTVLDAQETLFPFADQDISGEALKVYRQQGIDIRLQSWVKQAEIHDQGVTLHYLDENQRTGQLHADKVVMAVGRVPNTEGLFAPEVEVILDENGYVHVDEQCMTNLPEVFAIGDLVLGPMLAHKGIAEAQVVADAIVGKISSMDNSTLPNVIYTIPEIAWIGRTEKALATAGIPVKSARLPFTNNTKALAHQEAEGFVKILAHAETDRLLGVHIIGPEASELIAEAVLAMEFSASSEDLANTVHAFPSLSEILRQAAVSLQANG